jgi:hypothetical protein
MSVPTATISDPLLDHLVGDGNEPRRHLDAKHFRVAGLMANSNLEHCTTGRSAGVAHRPDCPLALLLALRPSKLSGRDAKHLTEMTCQMALVRKAHGICNLRQ